MTALQFESGLLGMVELFCVELKQGDFAPLVFMVAFLADILFNMVPVQAMPGDLILCDCFVAALAQFRLGGLVEAFMAVPAFAFKFGMFLDDLAGHQHITARIRAGLHDYAK